MRAAASAARFSAWRAAHGAAPRVPKRRGADVGAAGTGRVFKGGGGLTDGREDEAGEAFFSSAFALRFRFFLPISDEPPSGLVRCPRVGALFRAYTTGRLEPKARPERPFRPSAPSPTPLPP